MKTKSKKRSKKKSQSAPNDKSLRDDLLALLQGDSAHVAFEAAIKDLPPDLRGKRPEGADHSAWELLEHLRIAQWDILEYARNPKHISPEFPSGYWPSSAAPPNDKAWDKSVRDFFHDQKAVKEWIKKPSTNLLAPIPHAKNQTLLSKVLLTADHNSYHLGQLVLVRRLLGAWH